ncbi:MAG: hypothetical protein Q9191_001001 [Dirinaria sp. TL-2023a]
MDQLRRLFSKGHPWDYFRWNFYRVHLSYFILTIIVSSVIVYGSGVNGNSDDAEAQFRLRYIDALFLCASAMTNTGLNTVNLGSITAFQQSVLAILLLLGNIVTVSVATIWIRRHFFRQHANEFVQHSQAGRQVVEDIDRESAPPNKEFGHVRSASGNGSVRRRSANSEQGPALLSKAKIRSSHLEVGHGGFPYPWDTTGRFRSLSETELEEIGGVEYRALGVLIWLLPAYVLFWLALGLVFLVPYSYRGDVAAIIRDSQPGNLIPGWWATFVIFSGFANGGLSLLNASMIPFQGFYLILILTGAVMLAGNGFFPVFLRGTIWTMAKLIPQRSRLRHSFAFLLDHPRRCFILLFPSINTWYLAAIQGGLHLLLWAFWFILQIGYPPVWQIPAGPRVISGLYQALGVRMTGFYILSLSEVAPALLVLYTGAMYVSGLPVIISIRSTNIYEERSLGVQDTNDHAQAPKTEKSYIGTHFRKQLALDAWWLFIPIWLICIVERDGLAMPAPGFSLFSVIVETVSAFGTIGLSNGVPYDNYSFCGAWHTLSKLILIVVMIRGRHRGLPMAIDRAVLLPGQELMQRMDKEYNGKDTSQQRLREGEEKVRQEEGGSQVEKVGMGQDPEQDRTIAKRMDQGESEKDIAQTA